MTIAESKLGRGIALPITNDLASYVQDRVGLHSEKVDQLVELFASTPEGKLALEFGLHQALMVRALIRSGKSNLEKVGWLHVVGGHDYNPERAIDFIGPHLLDTLLHKHLTGNPIDLFVEERGFWEKKNPGAQGAKRNMVVDPIDGTSNIEKGLPYIANGLAVYDENGNLLSAVAASLTSDELVFVEGDSVRMMKFDDRNLSIEILKTEMPSRANHPRFAILKRRLEKYPQERERVNKVGGEVKYETFGGWAVIQLLGGEIEVMMDIVKGQMFHEVMIWGGIAQAAGYVVRLKRNGKEFSFTEFMELSKNYGFNENIDRVQIVICRNQDVADKLSAFKDAA